MEGSFSNYKSFHLVLVVLVAVGVANKVHADSPCIGFYSSTCPQVESIVKETVESYFKSDAGHAARLLRMHFHDCFVRGCDASILIEGSGTERSAVPNSELARSYEVVDKAKEKLEAQCPGVVSCADILTLAARDSVVLSGGQSWQVPTGRRDGRVSIGSETSRLAGPNDTIPIQKKKFSDNGLNTEDLVILTGGHTIGTTACNLFTDRIYGPNGTVTDASIDPSFVPFLRQICPQNQPTKRVPLDTGSQFKFDTSYFGHLQKRQGILRSDQLLWTDPSTKGYVQKYSALGPFNAAFGKSMVKMGNNAVLTGSNGEIRKKCSAVN